jgi:hypothetical protein
MNQTVCKILLLGLITDRDGFRGAVSAIPPSISRKKKNKKKVKNKNYKVKNKVLIFFFGLLLVQFFGLFWSYLLTHAHFRLIVDPCFA